MQVTSPAAQAPATKLFARKATGLVRQASAWDIFVYNTKWYGPYAANVGGIRFSPIGSGQDMRWAYYK